MEGGAEFLLNELIFLIFQARLQEEIKTNKRLQEENTKLRQDIIKVFFCRLKLLFFFNIFFFSFLQKPFLLILLNLFFNFFFKFATNDWQYFKSEENVQIVPPHEIEVATSSPRPSQNEGSSPNLSLDEENRPTIGKWIFFCFCFLFFVLFIFFFFFGLLLVLYSFFNLVFFKRDSREICDGF